MAKRVDNKVSISVKHNAYFSQLKKLFFHPKVFSNSVDKVKDYREVMFFYVKTYFLFAVLSFIIGLLVIGSSGKLTWILATSLFLNNILLGTALSFVTPFIFAGIIHLGILIFGGKEGYFNTYNPSTYGATLSVPYTIITSFVSFWIVYVLGLTVPLEMFSSKIYIFSLLVSTIQLVHVTYFEVLAISKSQKITKWKALFSIILIPLILIILVAIVLVSLSTIISTA